MNLARRYRTTGVAYYLWWSLSFYLYLITFAMEAMTVGSNWSTPLEYQLYIIGSSGLVGTMSAGTGFLAFPPKVAKGYAYLVGILMMGVIAASFVFPPVLHGTWIALNGGRGIVGLTQVFYIALVSVGGTVVLAGALWSWWKTKRGYNLLIGAGVLLSGLAGTLASQGMGVVAFPFVNLVAVVLIFLGYVMSRSAHAARAQEPSMSHKA